MCYDSKQIAMTRQTDLKEAIEKLKKLKALQAKATDKLNRIADDAAGKPRRKKAAPARKTAAEKPRVKKARSPAKKPSFWQKLFGKKSKRKR